MKRLDRLKQWAGERMGGEVKTTLSEDFKAMEGEMQLRHEGRPSLTFELETNKLTSAKTLL